jgi:hypothetical protein
MVLWAIKGFVGNTHDGQTRDMRFYWHVSFIHLICSTQLAEDPFRRGSITGWHIMSYFYIHMVPSGIIDSDSTFMKSLKIPKG